MRGPILVLTIAACNPSVSRDQQLCAKSVAMFAKCDSTDTTTKIDHELALDRWRGLCRAVFTGETDQLLPESLQLYVEMNEATKQFLREQAECGARATTCGEYEACSK